MCGLCSARTSQLGREELKTVTSRFMVVQPCDPDKWPGLSGAERPPLKARQRQFLWMRLVFRERARACKTRSHRASSPTPALRHGPLRVRREPLLVTQGNPLLSLTGQVFVQSVSSL